MSLNAGLPKSCLSRLLGAALLLPTVIVVVAAFGFSLKSLGDVTGAAVVLRVAQGTVVLWVLSLIGLLLAVAAKQACGGSACCDEDEEA